MRARASKVVAAVHRLAVHYHWTEPETLRLSVPRREALLGLIAGDQETELLADLLPVD